MEELDMSIKSARLVSTLSAGLALLWCLLVGAWIWMTPIRYAGSRSSGTETIPFEEFLTFAQASRLGVLPLVVPVLLAALATWAAWKERGLPLALSTVALVAFTIVSGFSIGVAYLVATAAVLCAWLIRLNVDAPR